MVNIFTPLELNRVDEVVFHHRLVHYVILVLVQLHSCRQKHFSPTTAVSVHYNVGDGLDGICRTGRRRRCGRCGCDVHPDLGVVHINVALLQPQPYTGLACCSVCVLRESGVGRYQFRR